MTTKQLYTHLWQVPSYQNPNPLLQINYEHLAIDLMDYGQLKPALEHDNVLFKHGDTPLWHLNKYSVNPLTEYTYGAEDLMQMLVGAKKAGLTIVVTNIKFLRKQFAVNVGAICKEHLPGLERRLLIDEILVDL